MHPAPSGNAKAAQKNSVGKRGSHGDLNESTILEVPQRTSMHATLAAGNQPSDGGNFG